MGSDRGWLFDGLGEDGVVVGRKSVAAWVFIDGRLESTYGRTFLYPSAKPIVVAGNDLKVFFSEVMVIFAGVLHH